MMWMPIFLEAIAQAYMVKSTKRNYIWILKYVPAGFYIVKVKKAHISC